ncbi:MAG: cation:proton antiporter, partial [Gemmatimonadota bacterium]
LGVFSLMLLGGLELHPREIGKAWGPSLAVALSAMVLPLALGTGTAWVVLPDSDYKAAQALFVGVGLAITAVPVAIRVLMELNLLQSKLGKVTVSAAVFDDVLGLILLAGLTALIRTGGLPGVTDLLAILGKVGLFFLITTVTGVYLLPAMGRFLRRLLKLEELEFSFLLIIAFGFSVLAEVLAMHFIVGAFLAGLFFERSTIDEKVFQDVKKKLTALTSGFLAPIFFASIGFQLELSALTAMPGFVGILVGIAFFSKLVGAGLPARFTGFGWKDSAVIGTAMSARGAVELVIAGIALRAGLFQQPSPPPPIVENLFSAIVIVAIVTTVIVPIALRFLLKRDEDGSGDG